MDTVTYWGDDPRLIRRDCGGWMAMSTRGAPYRIAVVADTADAARIKFRGEAEEWDTLLGRHPA